MFNELDNTVYDQTNTLSEYEPILLIYFIYFD